MIIDALLDKASTRPAAVIGAGTLGRRIALMLAAKNGQVLLFDTNPAVLDAGLAYARETLPSVVASISDGQGGRIEAAVSLEAALENA